MQPIGPQSGTFPVGTQIANAFNPAAAHGLPAQPQNGQLYPAPKVPGLMGRNAPGYGGVNPQRMRGANGPSR